MIDVQEDVKTIIKLKFMILEVEGLSISMQIHLPWNNNFMGKIIILFKKNFIINSVRLISRRPEKNCGSTISTIQHIQNYSQNANK